MINPHPPLPHSREFQGPRKQQRMEEWVQLEDWGRQSELGKLLRGGLSAATRRTRNGTTHGEVGR